MDRGTAMKEIDRALEIDPSNEIFYYTKAAFTWTRGKPKDAIRVLQAFGVVYARLANYDAAWLHARIAEHQGYPAGNLISRLAQLAPEPIW